MSEYVFVKQDIISCKKCPLYQSLDYGLTPQWGVGSSTAKLLIVNLIVNAEAHLCEKPLQTRDSILLHNLLHKADVPSSDVFVTNLVKCTCKPIPAQPFRENLQKCKEWLQQEIAAMPTLRVLLCFGVSTLDNLLVSCYNRGRKRLTLDDKGIYAGLPVSCTYSLEEIFRKSALHTNHAIDKLKECKAIYENTESQGRCC